MSYRNRERAALSGIRPDLIPAARAYARAKRCAVIHANLMRRSFARYGDHGPLVSGIGADHFPEPVKARARTLACSMNRFAASGDALRPPRVRRATMRALRDTIRARFPHTYYL